MWGAVVLVVILVVVMPVGIIMSLTLVAAGLGHLLKDDAERRAAGTVWPELNN
jgi:hypothetical protein